MKFKEFENWCNERACDGCLGMLTAMVCIGRKSMADFDWDISKRRRKEMVEISEELFGKENVAPICTFNSLSTKVAIRIGDCCVFIMDDNYKSNIIGCIADIGFCNNCISVEEVHSSGQLTLLFTEHIKVIGRLED